MLCGVAMHVFFDQKNHIYMEQTDILKFKYNNFEASLIRENCLDWSVAAILPLKKIYSHDEMSSNSHSATTSIMVKIGIILKPYRTKIRNQNIKFGEDGPCGCVHCTARGRERYITWAVDQLALHNKCEDSHCGMHRRWQLYRWHTVEHLWKIECNNAWIRLDKIWLIFSLPFARK